MLRAAAASVIGPSHKSHGIPNQDAFVLRGHRGGWLLAVADGLGSKPFSDIGSAIAARTAIEVLARECSEEDPRKQIEAIYKLWLKRLPVSQPALAASTLLFVACDSDGYGWLAQLGDGAALIREEGATKTLTNDRAGFGNETEALGVTKSFGAWSHRRVALTHRGDGVVLMTDGVADDLKPETLGDFYDALLMAGVVRNKRRFRRWIERELEAWTTRLHSDDKTLGMIFRD
ncbi:MULTISPECIES: PP2C family serine/threonine-protein phosphatase [Marinobacter]|uniref:PP2C family serine/threonine-protein phosphatase n=1 Tax=Marinobacter TaxID=2742 RepID=UPI001243EB7B|nr:MULTISPECIES: PP2C family serine/threonine-protein phosphatase [Marinobacter]MBL3559111.1 protein phosphatase 2C domain-containing protein [Marinobacter sp. JB05H06]